MKFCTNVPCGFFTNYVYRPQFNCYDLVKQMAVGFSSTSINFFDLSSKYLDIYEGSGVQALKELKNIMEPTLSNSWFMLVWRMPYPAMPCPAQWHFHSGSDGVHSLPMLIGMLWNLDTFHSFRWCCSDHIKSCISITVRCCRFFFKVCTETCKKSSQWSS